MRIWTAAVGFSLTALTAGGRGRTPGRRLFARPTTAARPTPWPTSRTSRWSSSRSSAPSARWRSCTARGWRSWPRSTSPKGVAFLGINANSQDGVTQIAAYARVHGIEFPVLKDLDNQAPTGSGRSGRRRCSSSTPSAWSATAAGSTTSTAIGYSATSARPATWRRPSTSCWPASRSASRRPKSAAASSAACEAAERRQPGHVLQAHRPASCRSTASNATAPARSAVRADRLHEGGRLGGDDRGGRRGRADAAVARRPEARPVRQRPPADRRREAADPRRGWPTAPRGRPKDLPPAARRSPTGWQLPKQAGHGRADARSRTTCRPRGRCSTSTSSPTPASPRTSGSRPSRSLPGNRAVVHHILVFDPAPGQPRCRPDGGTGGFLAAYVPGLRPLPFPAGMAKRIPAGVEARLPDPLHAQRLEADRT